MFYLYFIKIDESHSHRWRQLSGLFPTPPPILFPVIPSLFPTSRMPSSTRWCTTPSRRPCWPIRARSASGTSTRPTSQTS